MWDGMSIQPLRSIPDYLKLVEGAGFKINSVTDLTGGIWSDFKRAAGDASAAS